LTPVEEAAGFETTKAMPANTRGYDVVANPDLAAEARAMRTLMRRERSSAYWFAAAKWGMGGLLIGSVMGASLMYVASVAQLPVAQDAVARGAAIAAASNALRGEPGGVTPVEPR
jgi:hypothetical protein